MVGDRQLLQYYALICHHGIQLFISATFSKRAKCVAGFKGSYAISHFELEFSHPVLQDVAGWLRTEFSNIWKYRIISLYHCSCGCSFSCSQSEGRGTCVGFHFPTQMAVAHEQLFHLCCATAHLALGFKSRGSTRAAMMRASCSVEGARFFVSREQI